MIEYSAGVFHEEACCTVCCLEDSCLLHHYEILTHDSSMEKNA